MTEKIIKRNISDEGHKWEKQNLMTISSKKGGYDIYKCKNCGLKGKMFKLGIIENLSPVSKISDRCLKEIIDLDDDRFSVGNEVKITFFNGVNNDWINIKPGTIHKIVKPPEEEKLKYPNTAESVWVMGLTKPVRLLFNEFNFI